MAAQVLHKAAELLARENPDMTVRALIALSAVAVEEGQGPRHYHTQTGIPEQTISRLLLDLSDALSRRRDTDGSRLPGIGLIHAKHDPENLSRISYYLTPKGKNLFRNLAREIQKSATAMH